MEYSILLVYGHNTVCLEGWGGAQLDSGVAMDRLVQKTAGSSLKLVTK